MMELQKPRPLIHRWNGHDIHVLVDHPYVYLRAADVEAAAGIPPWSTGETLLLDDDTLTELNDGEYYPLDRARARALEVNTDQAAAFLAWLDEHEALFLEPSILERAHKPVPFTDAYEVRRAATLLSDDPTISIGRDRLFELMASLGWIRRGVAGTLDWRITALAHTNDWLTLRDVIVPAAGRTGKRTYRQVHVTPAGLNELRRTLHALGRSTPTTPPQPTLFD